MPRRAALLLVATTVVAVVMIGACDFFPRLPCEDDINCPAPKLCCDGTCVTEEELEEIEDAFLAGEFEEDGVTEEDLEESGCLPRD